MCRARGSLLVALAVLLGYSTMCAASEGNPVMFGLPKLAQPPVLDGTREAGWDAALRLECSPAQVMRDGVAYGWRDSLSQLSEISVNQLQQSPGEPSAEARTGADVSAVIWQGWDDQDFYYLAEVRDNVQDTEGSGAPTNWWERDSMTLYVDLVNSREQWQADRGLWYEKAHLNLINYLAAPQASSPKSITWEWLAQNNRTPSQDPVELAGMQYAYRYAGNEFGGTADYVIEGKIPWSNLLKHGLPALPAVGAEMGFMWIVPDPDGDDNYGGQIQSWGWGDNPWDYSTWVFADETGAMPAVRVNSPNGGEQWGVGTVHRVYWYAQPAVAAVRIEYSTDGGDNWQEVAASTPNDGAFDWTLPATPARQVLLRLTDASDGAKNDVSNKPFAIIAPPDYAGNGVVDYDGFALFANRFNTSAASDRPTFTKVYDMDGNGRVDGGDFFIMADNYGRSVGAIVIPSPAGPGAGPYANAGATFSLTVPGTMTGINGNQQLDIGVQGAGLVGVTQVELELEVFPAESFWGISFTPAPGWVSPGALNEGLWSDTRQQSGTRVRVSLARLGAGAVSGSALLGTFRVPTSWWMWSSREALLRVTRVAVGGSSTEQDVFGASALGLEVGINREWVWHRRGAIFPGEPLDIFAQVTGSVTSVQAEVHATVDTSLVGTVVLLDNGVSPDVQAGDGQYGGRWAGTSQVGGYWLDLVLGQSGGGQIHRTRLDYVTVAHTIVSIPDRMLASSEAPANVRIPLLIEDDGSGYLHRGFLSAQFELPMTNRWEPGPWQWNGPLPRGLAIDTVGTVLGGRSLRLEQNPSFQGDFRLLGAVAGSDSVRVGASPGPGQKVLAYVRLDSLKDLYQSDVRLLQSNVGPVLFGESAEAIGTMCCGNLERGRGDIDTSGAIEGFDASLALMHVVRRVDLYQPGDPRNDAVEATYGFTLPSFAGQMADVSQQMGVTAFDASLMMRREVGLISHFPAEEGYYRLWDPPTGWWNPPTSGSPKVVAATPRPLWRALTVGPVEERGAELVVPVALDELEGVLAGSFAVRYDGQQVEPVLVRRGALTAGYLVEENASGGIWRVALAGALSSVGAGRLLELVFRPLGSGGLGGLEVSEVQLNEGEVVVEVVSQVAGASRPRAVSLSANYPNPFNPSTVIRYELPSAGGVDLGVYNLAGQCIRRLVAGGQVAGVHAVVWDGRDGQGRSVSSGLYLYRLGTENTVLVRKMMLVK